MKTIAKLLWVVLGSICIAAIVWFGGPLLAFADYRPLESVNVRLIVIAVLLVLWLGRRAFAAMRAALSNRKLFDSLKRSQPVPQAGGDDEQSRLLQERFDQAVDTMRDLRVGGDSWLSRLSNRKRFVYQLPWYLFIGPPGSGKTTALLRSGLQFPLAERLGEDPVRGIGGTRHCDWWFTDSAVLIDTAGRYTTQDSDATSDAREWTDFLKLLSRYRPRQPINGILVVISAADLLGRSDDQVEQHATAVRNRLQELIKTLQNSFPVYVLVTKTDLIAGFNEFFGALDREQRAQVWGTTFDYREREARSIDTNAAADRFDQLIRRIDEQTLPRIEQERDPSRRTAILAFASQVNQLRAPLLHFLRAAFPDTRLAHPMPVRGLYLTSGTQEGNPIDRVMGVMARSLGLQRQMLPPAKGSGKAFFLTRLFNEVIFAESPIAGTNLRWERRTALVKWGCAALIGAAAIASIIGWSWSYFNNRNYVQQVQAKVDVIREAIANGRPAPDPRTLMPLYAALRDLARTEDVDPANPKVGYTLGLFQGEKLAEGARQTYNRFLQQTLAPALAARVTAVLRASAPNPEFQYETLKTYVMLTNPERLDRAAIRGWTALDLELNQRAAYDADARNEMLQHIDTLLAGNAFQDAIVLDQRALDDARGNLLRTPFPQRVYNRLRRQGVSRDLAEFRIDRAGGPSANLVFVRNSGKPLSEGVPALYTYDGYYRGFNKALDDSLRELADEETWVLGITDSDNARRAADPTRRPGLANEVRVLYLQDYANVWDRLISDIAVKRGSTLTEIIQNTRMLSAPDSPLTRLTRAIVREVSLTENDGKPIAERAASAANTAVDDAKRKLEAMLGRPASSPSAGGAARPIEAIVDDRFDALRQYARGSGNGPAPIDQTVALLNDLYMQMIAIETAIKNGTPPPPSDVGNKIKAEAPRMPEPARSMVAGLAAQGDAQQQRQGRDSVNGTLKTAVTPFCQKATERRYPFVRSSTVDTLPADFAMLFAAGGLLDDFFVKNLAQQVDTTVRPWRFRQTGPSALSDAGSLIQFERAATIRSVFFVAGPASPAVRVDLKPLDMDPSILQFSLDVDGQVLKYAHGPSVPKSLTWPGPGGTGQIRMQMSPPGASGASGLVFNGAWAIFRMFDQATITPTSQPERFNATFKIDGKPITFEVTTSSVRNPFGLPELAAFRCPGQL